MTEKELLKTFQNEKGFYIIPMNREQVIEIFSGYGICDHCGKPATTGYLVPVMGHKWYCTECYDDWMTRAVNYEEDREYEMRVLRKMEEIIKVFKVFNPSTP